MCALRCTRLFRLQKAISPLVGKSPALRTFKTEPRQAAPPQSRKWRKLLAATAAGVGVGAYFTLSNNSTKEVILNKGDQALTVIKEFPNVKISRQVTYPYDDSGLEIVLFQYPTCPFCCKVRAFLDYNGLSYKVVEVNPVMRQQIKWTDYKKVPIVLVKAKNGYIQLNDSSMIISALATYLNDRNAGNIQDISQFYPSISYSEPDGTVKSEILNRYFLMNGSAVDEYAKQVEMEERKWRKWADDVLVHVLSPNVYRTTNEALDAFKWFSFVGDWDQHFSTLERQFVIYVGAFAMWLIGKKLKNKYHLKEDVRQSLYDECNVWLDELKKRDEKYHGGNRPDLSDLAVYGVLSSIEGCEAFQDVLRETNLKQWYMGMKKEVNGHSGTFLYLHNRHQ
ncbi:prostaglandin E synthase 2 [Cimex lectularius]|uniref:Glutaredoxin domain-containing protein n=1 Tax=Cimex lectularius TaxID=79782 RepID=A0A8I6RDH7_CIMLE|nr:prostaglandin E synthase 2 [Cimex lectularius]